MGGQRQGGQRLTGQGPSVWQKDQESQEGESFVLRTYVVGGMGIMNLHID